MNRYAARIMLLSTFCTLQLRAMSQPSITSLYRQNQTPAYEEIIRYYQTLDSLYDDVHLFTCGQTDAGEPLYLLVVDSDRDFDPAKARARGKAILLINNGIHPGEPDGIDASIVLLDSLLHAKDLNASLQHLVVCVVPVYNTGGCLNRNGYSRANQNGPEMYGFRGNARNYDLNRDFIKCDTHNARSFASIFHSWDPDVFVDTHVSNGADYQYVMTLIPTQYNKLSPPLGTYLHNTMLPFLYDAMQSAGFPMCPYVNEVDEIPDNGIMDFLDYPRYSTGYTALFNTIGFMPETHMLKPYSRRVDATIALLRICIQYTNAHAGEIIAKRREADSLLEKQKVFPVDWALNKDKVDSFFFRGYEALYKTSKVSGLQRLYYDRDEPYEKNIPYYQTYEPSCKVDAPDYYILPAAWDHVADLLTLNGVRMQRLEKDTLIRVASYYIDDFKTTETPFEGHYLHSGVKVHVSEDTILYRKGDYLIPVDQKTNRYIVETLEPQAPDSFFAWGFFDAILMQKEYFSDYVFEDLAADILEKDPALRKALNDKIHMDDLFAQDAHAQLAFVYAHSPYMEKSYRRYPVARVLHKL